MSVAAMTIEQLHTYHHAHIDAEKKKKRPSFAKDSHEQLVAENLFQVLEERYGDLSEKELDAIIMLLLENSLD